VPPLVAAPAFNLRKPPSVIYTLDQYVEAGTLTAGWRRVLAGAVRYRRNVLVAGGTASGKTTLVNALLHEITGACPRDRIVVLEDTVELQCSAPDCLALRTSESVRLRDLVMASLRTSPDRIVVGEVRDEAALDLLDAWETGHPGGVATLHANDPLSALHRLDRLAQRANAGPQGHLVGDAIHLVVMIAGGSAGRKVTEIARVDAAAGRVFLLSLDCLPAQRKEPHAAFSSQGASGLSSCRRSGLAGGGGPRRRRTAGAGSAAAAGLLLVAGGGFGRASGDRGLGPALEPSAAGGGRQSDRADGQDDRGIGVRARRGDVDVHLA
jgi:type IV secretion system protein VirB11